MLLSEQIDNIAQEVCDKIHATSLYMSQPTIQTIVGGHSTDDNKLLRQKGTASVITVIVIVVEVDGREGKLAGIRPGVIVINLTEKGACCLSPREIECNYSISYSDPDFFDNIIKWVVREHAAKSRHLLLDMVLFYCLQVIAAIAGAIGISLLLRQLFF